jgi:periplasmic copper chaperone A
MKEKPMALFGRRTLRDGLVGALIVAATGLAALAAQAADYNVGSMHISDAWARATPKGAGAGAAYLTVTNNGSTPDRLSCTGSEAAAKCEVHSVTVEDGVMKMRPIEDGLEIKPGETVTLKPGRDHIMLLDLKHPLEEGNAVEATLKFDHAGTVAVEFPVAALGAAQGNSGTMMMQGGGNMMMRSPKQ